MGHWEDGGPLDPPETYDVDVETFLHEHPCGECFGKYTEDDAKDQWTCQCGGTTYTLDEMREEIAEDYWDGYDAAQEAKGDGIRDGDWE